MRFVCGIASRDGGGPAPRTPRREACGPPDAGGQPPAPPAGKPAAPRTPAMRQGSRASHIQIVSVDSAVAISTLDAATRLATP